MTYNSTRKCNLNGSNYLKLQLQESVREIEAEGTYSPEKTMIETMIIIKKYNFFFFFLKDSRLNNLSCICQILDIFVS